MSATPLNITLDNDPQQLVFSGRDGAVKTLTITNNDSINAAEVLVNVVRADLLTLNDLSLTDEEKAGAGYQIINDTWFEVRENALDSWHAVDDWATPYSVGALNASASASFDIRINTPSPTTDIGRIAFAIMISARPADTGLVNSVVIDQTAPSVVGTASTTLTVTVDTTGSADDTVSWSSSDTGIFTIDSGTGVATGVSAGKAIVRAVSNQNSNKKSSRFFEVT